AEQSLISDNLVDHLCISTKELSKPISMLTLTGQTFSSVTHKVPSLHFVISGNHHEL
ncbi:hypothetical protein GOODEAATRI_034544, partial [Goodea atripinnis]